VAIFQPPPPLALPSPLAAWSPRDVLAVQRGITTEIMASSAHQREAWHSPTPPSTRLQAARLATEAAAAVKVPQTTAPSRPTLRRRAVARAAAAAGGARRGGGGGGGCGVGIGGGIFSSPTAAATCAHRIPRRAASGAPLISGGRSPGTPPRSRFPPPPRPPGVLDGGASHLVGAQCGGRRKRP